jgi:hypothetical protein
MAATTASIATTTKIATNTPMSQDNKSAASAENNMSLLYMQKEAEV